MSHTNRRCKRLPCGGGGCSCRCRPTTRGSTTGGCGSPTRGTSRSRSSSRRSGCPRVDDCCDSNNVVFVYNLPSHEMVRRGHTNESTGHRDVSPILAPLFGGLPFDCPCSAQSDFVVAGFVGPILSVVIAVILDFSSLHLRDVVVHHFAPDDVRFRQHMIGS